MIRVLACLYWPHKLLDFNRYTELLSLTTLKAFEQLARLWCTNRRDNIEQYRYGPTCTPALHELSFFLFVRISDALIASYYTYGYVLVRVLKCLFILAMYDLLGSKVDYMASAA